MVTRPRSPAGHAVGTGLAATTPTSSKRLPISYTYVVAAVVLAVLFWVVESLIHVAIFRQGNFQSQLLTLDPHEIWKRLLFGAIIIVFGVYAQHGINIRRRTEVALKTSEKKYRTLIEKAMNPVVLFDDAGRFLEFNQATLSFFQLDDAALRSMSYRHVGLPEDASGPYPDHVFRPRLADPRSMSASTADQSRWS